MSRGYQGSWGSSGSWCSWGASSWVAASAASAGEDLQRYYDDSHMQDMTQQERDEAGMTTTVSRRAEKLGKAFQNWRRVQLKLLDKMQSKKMSFVGCWDF